MSKNYFIELNNINVNENTEKKGQLTYLSWAWAWAEVKKLHPDASYKVYEQENGLIYWHDGKTAWVKTGVTINGIEHIEYLPIMDYRNNSIQLDKLTSKDVNTAIQRSITKAIARHGLGLYIYAGEDLPEEEAKELSKVSEYQIKKIRELYKDEEITKMLNRLSLDNMQELNKDQAQQMIGARDNVKKID